MMERVYGAFSKNPTKRALRRATAHYEILPFTLVVEKRLGGLGEFGGHGEGEGMQKIEGGHCKYIRVCGFGARRQQRAIAAAAQEPG